ncbi:MAG: SDR family NAD(P)-dependent oxidoreductase [Methylocystis sp.]|uniref:SDR family NAD(P)-dependent oxidoreductase n=1 Tax=Methylocystis sp. TaxID=1911079 RepID=UPI003DA45D26
MSSVIVLTPEHRLDATLAIAGLRAGECGVLDLGLLDDVELIAGEILRFAGETGEWGVRWDAQGLDTRGGERLGRILPSRAPLLILAGFDPRASRDASKLSSAFEAFRKRADRLLIEVCDLETATAAAALGCDGLIVKGHEAGGRIGSRSTFILLQDLKGKIGIPYWAQGGVGFHGAAAAALAGAAGVVLREQLWLTDESPFDAHERKAFAQLDGSETVVIESRGTAFRFFSRSGRRRLQELESAAAGSDCGALLQHHVTQADDPIVPMGQDIAFAQSFAKQHGAVGRILAALRESVAATLEFARKQRCLAPDSTLAAAHSTKYPIVQGPMTRVSDVAGFALAVAEAGALPFVALSVLRKPQVQRLLNDTHALLGKRPWGVGVLGFVPLELRREQLEAIREAAPSFAIIGGGRPAQARELEAMGVSTYLHAPSPGLLASFLDEGARKFVFEGNECGGHTGPRTSFVLWEQAIETLLAARIDDPSQIAILFAGGVHDAMSAAMASVMAAPLAARGMKVGVVMGTAYLFTEEIIRSGALAQEFQNQAVACRKTQLLQSGAGLYTRCADTPFCAEFNNLRRSLILEGATRDEMLRRLETLNIGRLRIASKGLAHSSGTAGAPVDLPTQRREGLYMLGDAATMRSAPTTIAALHREVSEDSLALIASAAAPGSGMSQRKRAQGKDVAIIGMACLLPGARDVASYWRNIMRGFDAVREVPRERWEPETYFDPQRGAPDKVYSKWGGFLDDVAFDPTRYGVPPASLRSIEPMQLLALETTRRALEDAGLHRRSFDKRRASTIFGAGGLHDMGIAYIFRTELERYLKLAPGLAEATRREIVETLRASALPEWTEDSFPGFLGNVVAGRVANRFDLGGMNFTVDAACASSLAALQIGVKQLRDGDADMALVGAIDGTNNSVSFMAFAQTHALSPGGRCRPFDDSADGIAIGEGVAVLVLKRLADAERDGDRIRAVVKGIGGSSDGRNKSLTAPHPQGQVSALRRAQEDAGVDPATIGLIEAHGTGTPAGDKSEIDSLQMAFAESAIERQSCAIGSVKSMIGHTKVVAGLAGVIKSVLALEHKTLPPTIGVETPNRRVDFATSPFFINTQVRPWLASPAHPRRCGVSAFGFGGANFHAVLEEYGRGYRAGDNVDLGPRDAEPFFFAGDTREALRDAVDGLKRLIGGFVDLDLPQLACSHFRATGAAGKSAGGFRLALLAVSPEDLLSKLDIALEMLDGGKSRRHPGGVYLGEGTTPPGGVCFLFPGQGAQKVGMLRDLVVGMPELHRHFERADALLAQDLPQKLSRYIYPVPAFTDEERRAQKEALAATRVAQPALGVVELAAFDVLRAFGFSPDFVAGHSYGEYVALCAAGVIDADDLIRLSDIRGRITAQAGEKSPGTMAAVNAGAAQVGDLIRTLGLAVDVANMNAPDQTLIAGAAAQIEAAAAALKTRGLRVVLLPIGTAFHSPAMEGARKALAKKLEKFTFLQPRIPVFSNTTARPYPESDAEIRSLLARHIREPVRFVEEIEKLHEAGARLFVEVGPGQVMTGLVNRILADKPHAALAVDSPSRPGWLQLSHLLAEAYTLGCPIDLQKWFARRAFVEHTPEDALRESRAAAEPGPMVWRINGGRATPWREAVKKTRKSAVRAAAAQEPALSRGAAAPAAAMYDDARSKTHLAPVTTPRGDRNDVNDKARPLLAEPSQLAQIQSNIEQFIALQRDQQATLRDFIALQNRLLSAGKEQAITPASLGVPPIPTLPCFAAAIPTEEAEAFSTVAPEPPTTAPASPAPDKRQDRQEEGAEWASPEQFRADLIRAVSERTGYPEDMLDPKADMEADLGIDSIKRIEVFSELKDRYDFMTGRDEEAVYDELSGLKTLDGIVAWYGRQREGKPDQPRESKADRLAPAAPAAISEAVELETATAPGPVERLVLRPIMADLIPAQAEDERGAGGAVLFFGPPSPARDALATALGKDGHVTLLATPAGRTRALGDGRFEADARDEAAMQELRALIGSENHPPVGALILHLGLESARDGDAHADDARTAFLVAKTFETDLRDAAASGDGWLLTVTGMDGQFGLGGTGEFAPEAASVHGVAKSLAREWPGVRVKCLDVDPALPADAAAAALLAEWRGRDGDASVEVGLSTQGRWRLELAAEPLARPDLSALDLDSDSVLLVTGGARGVTASVALAIARAYRPKMVVVGTSPLPSEEDESTRNVEDREALKRIFIDRMRAGEPENASPARVQAAVDRLIKDREIRANLAGMRAAGAEVDYCAVDVGDEDAFGRLIDETYEKWGHIEGVIHGAGIIQDGLARQKKLESFDAVYSTKVAAARVLARKLRPEFLRFLLFFSSVAARFGNSGQTDYAAANEALNKFADRLSQEWLHVNVVSINWGPWDAGMVNEPLLRLMEKRNIHPIPLQTGVRMCIEELARRHSSEAEVLIAASVPEIAAPRGPPADADPQRQPAARAPRARSKMPITEESS